jgi:hypothetical protein
LRYGEASWWLNNNLIYFFSATWFLSSGFFELFFCLSTC